MEDKLARGFLFFAAVCQILDEFNKNTGLNLTADEYREGLRQYFPTLKRWRKE